ncbi:WD40 repeat-like protein [Mycena pura]|uniref:WD40 repeat-like protein n=1 Tax=Mycena pura TaxID=153505 RepID=A0AAD6V930_9AGAR|nr:WD40 repeat-like protein [Mycena pura]
MPETYSLLIHSADQLLWKPRPCQNADLYVTVTGGSRGLKTEPASTLPPQWNFESKFSTDSRSTEITIQLFHRRSLNLRKDRRLGECKYTVEDLLERVRVIAEQGAFSLLSWLFSVIDDKEAVALDLKLDKKHVGKLWVRLTLDRGNNELATVSTRAAPPDKEAATSASTHAAPTSSDTHFDDARDEWKKDICDKAKRTWQGLNWITKTIAPIVPEPFKGPLELFNAISDVAAKYIDNEKKLKDAIEKLSARLVEVNSLLLQSDSYNIDITESSQQLARLVVAEALKMDKIQKSHPVKNIPQQDDIASQITACLDRLNQETDYHHRRMTQAIARDIQKNLEFALASMLPSYAPKALFDADTTAGGRLSRRACTPETRKELLDRLENWALDTSTSSDTSPIFWLSGMAGTGKSTVAYTLCQRLRSRKRFAASFFCSRNDEKARSRAFIIPTIVRQLIPVYTRYAHAIRNVHLDDVVPASDRHVDELLIYPWLQSMEQQTDPQPSRLIVIDALVDEIEGGQGARFIEHLIKSFFSSGKTLRGLKFLVTSRPQPDIVEQCRLLQADSVYRFEYLQPEKAKEGLHHVQAEQKKRLKQIRDSGRLVKTGEDDLSVDSLYKTIIFEALRKIGPEVESLAPLVADVLEEADEEAVQNSLDALHAVVYVSPRDKCIYSYHKSFDDFVLNPQRSGSVEIAKSAATYFPTRTLGCFEIMNKSLHFNMCNLRSSYLLDEEDEGLPERITKNIGTELRYACRYWAAYLDSVRHDSDAMQHLATSLLDFSTLKILFWMEAMSLLKLDCRPAIHRIWTWALKVPNVDALNTYLSAVQRLWASFINGKASLSTPHIYISSLAVELGMSSRGGSSTLVAWQKCFTGVPVVEFRGITTQGALVSMQGHGDKVLSVAFSPDGTHIVSGSRDNTVRIWDAATGTEEQKLEGHGGAVLSVAFSPNGTHIVSGSHDETMRIWDAATGMEEQKLEGHGDWVRSVAFSPDGTRIVSGSDDKTVRIWDAATGTEEQKLEGHGEWVLSVAFSPNGTHIVSGSSDKTVRIWDAATGTKEQKLKGHGGAVLSVAFSPNGTHIVSGSSDETMRIWDAATGTEEQKLEGHGDQVESVAFSPDGIHIVSGSSDKTMRIWDAATGTEEQKLEGHGDWVESVAFSPDGTRIVSGSQDNTVRIWDAATGTEEQKLEGHGDWVLSVAFSPDGTRIMSGSSDKTVWIWDAATGTKEQKLEGHGDRVLSVAFSPNGTYIVSGSNDNTVRIWDAATGTEEQKLEGHGGAVLSVAFSPDGTHIVSGSHDKTMRIWDAATGMEEQKLEGHDDWVRSVAFSPDGTHIVSGSDDKTVRIWDAATGTEEQKLEGHGDWVLSVAFSPNGTRIVSGSSDKTVRIWDAATGTEEQKLEGHSDPVESVAFSPDGTHIVSGSSDKTVRIWDATTGTEEQKLEGHGNSVLSVPFLPAGTRIVSGSLDGTMAGFMRVTMSEVACFGTPQSFDILSSIPLAFFASVATMGKPVCTWILLL